MPLTLSLGDTSLAIDTLTDLSALVSQNGVKETLFKLAGVALGGNLPISQFSLLDTDISLSYASDPQTWNLDGGVFTFGISGGATGTLHVYSPGMDLFSYTKTLPALNGFDALADTSGGFTVPGGNFYVGISLQLKLDVNAGGSGNIGSVGIQGSADASGTYTFSFFKSVSANTSIGDALIAAFSSFTLPLHDKTFTNLKVGDSILHNFKADLTLGLGFSYGIQTPSVAQSIVGKLPTTIGGVPSITAGVDPSAGLSLAATATFEYTGSFEAYVFKESDALGHYHLYRNTIFDRSFGISATASLITNAAVSVDGGNIATAVSSAIGGTTGQVIGQMVSKIPKVQSALDTAANDVNTTLTNILKPIQGGKAQLQASIETTDTKSILYNLSIDLSKPGFDLAAWDSICEGDFVAAIEQQHSGITVDAGSGLEQLHHRKTDFKFTFFNFIAEWTTTNINDYSIVYGGNSSFAFTNNRGLSTITNIGKSGKEIQFYFATSVGVDGAGNLTVQDPDLHVNLKSTSNPKFARELPKFLKPFAAGPGASDAFNVMNLVAGNPSAVIELDVVYHPSAYQRIIASPCPLPMQAQNAQDKTNYMTFAQAVLAANDDMPDVPDFSFSSPLDMDYEFWELLWHAQDDKIPPRLANRKDGQISAGVFTVMQAVQNKFDRNFNNQGVLSEITFALSAAQSFMNLCEGIGAISAPPAPGPNPLDAAQKAFASLNTQVGNIIKADVQSDYLLPTAAALGQLAITGGGQPVFLPPVLPTAKDPGYKLTVTLS